MDPELQRRWWLALAAFAGAVLLGYVVRVVAVRRLVRLFARTQTDVDDLVLAAVRRHVPLWFFLAGVELAARVAPVPERAMRILDRALAAALIVSLSIVVSNLGAGFLERTARRKGATSAATSLTQNLLRAVIILAGALLVLANLGISITPLLTALGVGSLAVGLALQPTLSNLFAGMHMALAKPVRVGDFVELEGGTRGTVEDIGWRATSIRDLLHNLIIVPNARLVEMVLTNYSLPLPEQSVLVQVGVSYHSDLAHVERVTLEVGREVLREFPGGVAAFEPLVRYHTFGDSAIQFAVVLRVQQFTDRVPVTSEFLKRLHGRYAAEGIEIPFPQRVLHGSVQAVPAPAATDKRR